MATNYRLPRMRTVKQAVNEIKQLDPDTAVSFYQVRRLVLSGVLPTVSAGNKRLINLDTLIEYLQNPTADKFRVPTAPAINGLRRIS